MKKVGFNRRERCPVCQQELKIGDRVRPVEMTTIHVSPKKKSERRRSYVHAECWEKIFPKKEMQKARRRILRQIRKNQKKKKKKKK